MKNLEEVLRAAGNPATMLRNSKIGAYVYPVVPAEYSNWRDEQRAWRETCVLFDQTHHMVETVHRGTRRREAGVRLRRSTLSSNFTVNTAKHTSPCSHDGYVIGDGILFYLEAEPSGLRRPCAAPNWLKFQAATGGYDVSVRGRRPLAGPDGKAVIRRYYRYQIQGPNAPR